MRQLKYYYFFWYSLLAFAVAGCGTLGYENVDTTRKALVVAQAEIKAANFLLQDLVTRRAISSSDARNALNGLQVAKNQLDTALAALDVAGDPALAESNLQRANIGISVVLQLLAPFAGEP